MQKLYTVAPMATPVRRHPDEVLVQWLTLNLVPDRHSEVPWSALYGRYLSWCHEEGWEPLGPTRLGTLIGCPRRRSNGQSILLGARLT